jgi:cytochrome c-type biogenesis protein CcmH
MIHLRVSLGLLFSVTFLTAQVTAERSALQRELEQEIMAPCCYGGVVADHESQAAEQVRAQIAQLIAEGKTAEEIKDMFVAIYGEQILARPRAQGFNLLAYIIPPALLLLGGLVVIYIINRMKTTAPQEVPPARKSYSEEFLRRVEQEMQDLNI